MRALGILLVVLGFVAGCLAVLFMSDDAPIHVPGALLLVASVLVWLGAAIVEDAMKRRRLEAMREASRRTL
ncbi:MAG: hypothetical protein ABMA13_18260 [Chthoniobacteraceae bacterium]